MLRLSTLSVIGVLACGSPAASPSPSSPAPVAAAPAEPAAPAGCPSPEAATGTAIALQRDDQAGLVSDGDDKGVSKAVPRVWAVHAAITADDRSAIAVIARKGCGGKPCDPQLTRVAAGKQTKQVALPETKGIAWTAEYPFMVEWLEIVDRDGDGAKEVWVSYSVTSPPEPAVGSTTYSHVAVYSLPDLALRWAFQHAVSPEASTLTCSTELTAIDADCDRSIDLRTVRTCRWRYCDDPDPDNPPPECKDGPQVDRGVHRRQANGEFFPPRDK